MSSLSVIGPLWATCPFPPSTGHSSASRCPSGICNTDLELSRGYMGFRGTLVTGRPREPSPDPRTQPDRSRQAVFVEPPSAAALGVLERCPISPGASISSMMLGSRCGSFAPALVRLPDVNVESLICDDQ